MPKKILVTGGLGFIGSNYILYILNKYKDYSIINLDKITYAGNKNNLISLKDNPRYEFVQGDICDKKLVNNLVNKVDLIVHFAAESHVDRSIMSGEEFIESNIVGTFVLLESALKNNTRFHHVSTDEVFGSLEEEGSFSEKTSYDPRSIYSASKASSDHLVRAFFHTHNLPITISNCSNNYGPYQHPEKLIPLFITNLINGKKMPLYGNGLNVRDWLYVEDHVKAIDLITHKGHVGETYCIGGNTQLSNFDVAKMILNEFGLGEDRIKYVKDRKGHDFRYAIDFSKIKKDLGWEPEYNFSEGLKKVIQWYKENKWWWEPLK